MSTDPELSKRLSYLLKHAQFKLTELVTAALKPYGIEGRELGVLTVLAGDEPSSQQQAAQRLGIDRTTMVALLDTLEAKGLVSRHPHEQDRRRNVVELTETGRTTLVEASKASWEAEALFLSPLPPEVGRQLKQGLHTILNADRD
ncbi:MarR family winged helix-turn-helix transcriptional regulator [Actinocrispum sp. NPDC049592]|uniref:MarR family winged helix-turn-helix transcriptional regulator n=1 Tax=Actinocrispum sp. NPDC049592 TaxID=3154835 RepID=UPI0034131D82